MTMEVPGAATDDILSPPVFSSHTQAQSHVDPGPGILWPVEPSAEARIPIRHTVDIVRARERGRHLGLQAGCTATELLLVQTVISELARNIILYAGSGEIQLTRSAQYGLHSLTVTAIDEGPGIANIEEAMKNGYSTSGGWGLGLPGIKQMTNQFEIFSYPGAGTKVIAKLQFV